MTQQRSYKNIENYKEMIKLLDRVEEMLTDAAMHLKDREYWNIAEDIYEIKMQFRRYLDSDMIEKDNKSYH